MKTPQDIFNIAAKTILDQGGPSLDLKDTAMCAYRGSEGRKCAAGAVLPDYAYRRRMEGDTIYNAVSNFKWLMPRYINQNLDLLNELQSAHDTASRDKGDEELPRWKWREDLDPSNTIHARLITVAETFELDVQVVRDFMQAKGL